MSAKRNVLKSQLPPIVIAATLLLLVLFWLVYRSLGRSRCDSILEQTADSVRADLEVIKIKGELTLGREKVQELTDSSQKVGLHLKACCIAQEAKALNAEQFQVCMSGAKDYQTQIIQVATNIKEANAAAEQHNPELARQKTDAAKEGIGKVVKTEKSLARTIHENLKIKQGASTPEPDLPSIDGSNTPRAPASTANPVPVDNNILAQANGGQVLVAPNDAWLGTNDGNEGEVLLHVGEEGVYAFKDEQPATFDRFATLVPGTGGGNLKEFELLAGDESPTGTFRSLGKFTVQNVKFFKSPYQEFKFEPVTAKYLKMKILSNYGGSNLEKAGAFVYEFKLFGKTNAKAATKATLSETKAYTENILAQSAGGQVLVAPNDAWLGTNDGNEGGYVVLYVGQEAVYAFKDEQPATFDRFATLVPETYSGNLKEFELLAGDESPTGTFRSLGKFAVQNVKMMKSPYQEFKFEPVTAKYLKMKILSNYGGSNLEKAGAFVYEFKLFGKTNQ